MKKTIQIMLIAAISAIITSSVMSCQQSTTNTVSTVDSTIIVTDSLNVMTDSMYNDSVK